jgi:hypothetical protein
LKLWIWHIVMVTTTVFLFNKELRHYIVCANQISY